MTTVELGSYNDVLSAMYDVIEKLDDVRDLISYISMQVEGFTKFDTNDATDLDIEKLRKDIESLVNAKELLASVKYAQRSVIKDFRNIYD